MQTRTRIPFCSCLVLAAALAATARPAAAQNGPAVFAQSDHYQCYFLSNWAQFAPTGPLAVADQFNPGGLGLGNLIMFRLCNPVSKIHNNRLFPINHPDDHLAFFFIRDPLPVVPRRALVDNQFGRQILQLREARVLAVPSGKALPGEPLLPIPAGLDHYLCYDAAGKEIDDPVILRDQFQTSRNRVLEPVLFCNPARKLHNGVVYDIQHPDLHMTCYTIRTGAVPPRYPFVTNQFLPPGVGGVITGQPELLCAPTDKLRWEEVQPGDLVQ